MNTETFKIICRAFYPGCTFEGYEGLFVAYANNTKIALIFPEGTADVFSSGNGWLYLNTGDTQVFEKKLKLRGRL